MKTIENTLRHQACPLCHFSSISFQGTIDVEIPTYYSTTQIELSKIPELWKCQECESSFTQNAIHEEDAIKLYSQGSPQVRWTNLPFEKAKTSLVISKLESLLNPGTRVLDIGCGSGTFLDFAKARGCQTHGVEYSNSSLEKIVQRGHKGFSDLSKVNDVFDVITAFDVVEHLYDVSHFLETCKSMLSPGGYLVLLTGDISCDSAKKSKSNWWYTQYPEHIVFPSKRFITLYSDLEVQDWVATYHAPPTIQRNFFLNLLRVFLDKIRRRTYCGYPSLSPDHYLVVLKKIS
jgi:SAM-dependent methyltransferase